MNEQTTTRFSDEAATCEECLAEEFTLNEAGLIAGPSKFEGETLASFHAYHKMMDGAQDEDCGEYWRIGNMICSLSTSGLVSCTTYETEESLERNWQLVLSEQEEADDE